jgi:hypothetical protein
MKLKHAAVLISVALLAACGGGTRDGDVRFLGSLPLTSGQKDTRAVQTLCPGCHTAIEVGKTRCEEKKCKAYMKWSEKYDCPSCRGSGTCPACTMMEQANGDCYNCKGSGVLIFQGQSPDCPNCKGSKKCPTCKGTMKCPDCEGNKTISQAIVKARAAKFVGKGEDDGLPPSDPRSPVPAEKKDDAKKDAAAPPTEEKK